MTATLLALLHFAAPCEAYQAGPYVVTSSPAEQCACVHVSHDWGESEECEAIEPVFGYLARLEK